MFSEGRFIKDLSILKRDLKNVIIIDNYPESYSNNPYNGIPITSWYDDPFDKELHKMVTGTSNLFHLVLVLDRLNQVDDVRDFIKKFVINDKVSMYQLYKNIGEPKRETLFESLINLWKKVIYKITSDFPNL